MPIKRRKNGGLRTRRFFAAAAVLAFAFVPAAPVRPQTPPEKTDRQRIESPRFEVGRASSGIKVDGSLEEEAWKTATVIPLPFEWQPGDNIPAPVRTECLVTYDTHNLYVAFRCFDPEPGKIRAHLMDRDDTDRLILDDHVSIMVDSFNDERRGFQFRVNPLGVQADANFSESEGYEDFSWDAIWDAAGRITDWGYALEIAIPLNQLRFTRTDGPQTWGFSAERSWPRDSRHRMTSHVRSRNVACIICQFNKLTGFEGITPSRNIELNPTVTGSRTDDMDMAGYPEGGLLPGKTKVDPGLTAKYGITPNLILNAAANPDFSQVEADVAQLQINRRFALFYPEKRPFFLEGADFFLTPIQAVFTRTVADPAWGGKVTGKVGRTAIGFFTAQDETTNLLFPSNQGSMQGALDQRAYGGVFRLRQDVGRMSTIGILYTGRAGDGYYNHLGGVDGFLRFDQKNSLSFQYLHSETDYPLETAQAFGQRESGFGGDAVNLDYQFWSRNWIAEATYADLSPGFRADYGFVPRVDTRDVSVMLFRQFWGRPGQWFNLVRIGLAGEGTWDHEGMLTDRNILVGLLYQGRLETQANLHGIFARTYFDGVYFDTADASLDFHIRPFSGAEFGLGALAGTSVDFQNSRLADIFSLGPRASLNLGRHFNVTASHDYERLFLDGRTIYTANLAQARLIYNFGVRAFVRAIVQYQDIRRDPSMYLAPVDSRNRGLFTQFLFSYKLNPRTVLFLGYSDTSRGGDFESLLGRVAVDITRVSRSFFLKIAYAWQL
jgi:hypothetical protein